MNKTKKIILTACILCVLLFLIIGLNPFLQTTEYVYESSEIPAAFDNYKICHISDLHCKSFGKENEKLLAAIDEMNPDIVVLTGDIVDEDHDDLSAVKNLFVGLKDRKLATYYITGNHELEEDATRQYEELLSLMAIYGVTDLDDKSETISIGEDSIYLTGSKWYSRYVINFLNPTTPEGFHILLYHGTDFFDLISDYNYDLILSGHIHGGIIRLPFINAGLLGNSGEFFPKYVSGVYQNGKETCTMIASRGLGDAFLPRFYNRPELICITLKTPQP